jgi:hypothetical protein
MPAKQLWVTSLLIVFVSSPSSRSDSKAVRGESKSLIWNAGSLLPTVANEQLAGSYFFLLFFLHRAVLRNKIQL